MGSNLAILTLFCSFGLLRICKKEVTSKILPFCAKLTTCFLFAFSDRILLPFCVFSRDLTSLLQNLNRRYFLFVQFFLSFYFPKLQIVTQIGIDWKFLIMAARIESIVSRLRRVHSFQATKIEVWSNFCVLKMNYQSIKL